MTTTIGHNHFTPLHRALKLPTWLLKRHYLKLQKALWKATEFPEPRYMHTDTTIGYEINIILGDMADVAEELKKRGIFMMDSIPYFSRENYRKWMDEKAGASNEVEALSAR